MSAESREDNRNVEIANFLSQLGDIYDVVGDTERSRTFIDAAAKIAASKVPIDSGETAGILFKGKGVGPSTIKEINQFLDTGTSERMQSLTTGEFAKKLARYKMFMSYYGITSAQAKDFYTKRYTTIEEVWAKEKLTKAQKIGIIWYEHIMQPIARKEVNLILAQIKEILNPHNIKWHVVGSYRRGAKVLHDIDLIIVDDGQYTLSTIIMLLSSLLVAKLALANSKFMGIIRLSEAHYGHRIDIYFKTPDSLPYAALALTGPKRFEYMLRGYASKRGLKLNEYGLYDLSGEGKLYPARVERDIFDHLGLKYLKPEERRDDFGELPESE